MTATDPQNPDAAANRAEFDRLMTAASVYRRRGDYAAATKSVQQALKLFPDNLDAQEFAADMIYAHGDIQKAADYYKAIMDIDPGRSSAETKYAKAILEIAEGQRQRELVQYMLDNPGKTSVERRNPTIAALLSIAPGFGHIYCGLYTLGIALFCSWVLAWMLFFWMLGESEGVAFTSKLTASSTAFACIAAAVHIYALIGAAQQAEKINSSITDDTPIKPD
ncbi:MAG: tetratricopeptide repeat protein [Armatimonadetes bacterium]|nr:tetratricopeptide repeat protein [Armatimonadota bacterium]